MTKTELRIAVAKLQGWTEITPDGKRGWPPDEREFRVKDYLPNFPDSMDACMRDLAPEIEAYPALSWRVESVWTYGVITYRAEIISTNDYEMTEDVLFEEFGETPSEAFCNAWLPWKEGD